MMSRSEAPVCLADAGGQTKIVELRRRDPAIDFVKWLAIIGVVWVHVPVAFVHSPFTYVKMLFGWVVIAFFGCAGFLSSDRPLAVARRTGCLLVPYVSVSLVSFLGLLALSFLGLYVSTNESYALNWPNFLRRLISGDGFGPQFYFLPYLVFIEVAVHFFRKLLALRTLVLIVFTLLVVQALSHRPPAGALGSGLDKWILYAFAYVGGGYLRGVQRGTEPRALAVGLMVSLFAMGVFHVVTHGKFVFFQLLAPVLLYFGVRAIPSGPLTSLACRYGPGGVFLWHAPLVLAVASAVASRASFGGAAICFAFALVGAFAIDRTLKNFRFGRWLTL